MKLLLSSVLLSVCLPYILLAQNTASINGYIKDAETGETLIAANIALIEINKGTSTNTLGYYSILNIKPGTYTLVASYIGYQNFEVEITLEAGDRITREIELTPETYTGEEVLVTSTREKEEEKDIGVAQLNTELITSLPSVFQADVFRSVQLLPGVAAASDFSSGLYIRGGGPDQTLILLDRTTVYNPTHFFGFFSTFNPDAIKNVQLYKGGYPAEYGGRLGSVLTIYNKDGNRNSYEGSLTAGLLASRAIVEGPIKNGSFMFAVRRSTLEPYLAILSQTTDGIPDSFYFLDINGKLNYDLSTRDKFSLAFYSGLDDVNFPINDNATIFLGYGNQTYNGNWTHIFSDRVFSNFTFTFSRYFNNPEFDIASTTFVEENNIWDASIKADVEYLASENRNINFGIWAGDLIFRVTEEFDGTTSFDQRLNSAYAAAYVNNEWRISEKLEVTLGQRLNYFGNGDYLRMEPRISTDYKLTPSVRLQAAYGRYNQFLTLVTNEAFSGFDTWYTAAEGVGPQWGDQFVLGAKTIPFTGYGLDVEVYYRTMNDIFEVDPRLNDISGLAYEDIFRVGDGYAYGLEVFFEKRSGRTTGFIGYTWSSTFRRFDGYNTDLLSGNNEGNFFPPRFDRTHDLSVVLTRQLSKTWNATFNYSFGTGQAVTEPLGRIDFGGNNIIGTDLGSFTVGNVNASRLPNYSRADVSFAKKATLFGSYNTEWQFQIINVLNQRNVWFYTYDFDSNPISRDEVQLLPIIPSLSYTITF
ncbi:MAG: TonB-dependent receptor [Bacteroidota bacterium]